MRVWPAILIATLAASACAHQETPAAGAGSGGSTPASSSGGSTGGSSSSGTGGSSNTGGSAAGGSSNTGGSANTGGTASDTGGSSGTASGGSSGSGGDSTGTKDASTETGGPSTPPMAGGKAMLIVGTIPLVGTDTQFEAALKARGMEVVVVQEKLATPAMAAGMRIIFMSYSMSSTAFAAEAFTDVPVPAVVTEQNLLPRIKMSKEHGFTPSNLTKITIIADHELAGGFPKGDVEVYGKPQEMFWGVPGPGGVSIAHITGQPAKITYFAYEKGAMMDGVPAPAKRVQFFHATHSPDPVDKNLYLNDNGLKLLGITIDWCLK
jgi:hypothetical protein